MRGQSPIMHRAEMQLGGLSAHILADKLCHDYFLFSWHFTFGDEYHRLISARECWGMRRMNWWVIEMRWDRWVEIHWLSISFKKHCKLPSKTYCSANALSLLSGMTNTTGCVGVCVWNEQRIFFKSVVCSTHCCYMLLTMEQLAKC